MIPDDGPLGLPHAALRGWTILLLSACAGLALVIAMRDGSRSAHARRPARLPPWLPVLAVGLLVRALASLAVDGQIFDVLVAYRDVGDGLFHGAQIWTGSTAGLATYPPAIYLWWAVSALVPASHPHIFAAIVRAPFWIADAGIAVLLLRVIEGERGRRAAWIYSLCPVAIAVPTLHGQADPVVDLLFAGAVVLAVRGRTTAGVTTAGVAIALKQWPVFFLPALLVGMPRRSAVRFVAVAAVPALLSFAAYGVVHPADAVRGFTSVATYRPHPTGLGSSLLFPLASGYITAINIAVILVCVAAATAMVRGGRTAYDAIAVAMLLFISLSPTVYDQYLMWPFPFLLLGGRLRASAVLGVCLLPAVLGIDLWTSQNDGTTPDALFVLGTVASLAVAASVLWRPPRLRPLRGPAAAPLPASP